MGTLSRRRFRDLDFEVAILDSGLELDLLVFVITPFEVHMGCRPIGSLDGGTVRDLSATSRKLGHGDLSVRVQPDGAEKDRLNADPDELQRTTDFIIREARRPVHRESEEWCDLAATVSRRVDFWYRLAQEQEPAVGVDVGDGAAPVAIPDGDAEAMIDTLIENVLAHTPEGTPFLVHVEIGADTVLLSVEDAGSGFSDGSVIDRGTSRGNSTGLRLDIVRRTVEGASGTLAIGESLTHSGAGIVVRLPLTSKR